MFETIIETCTTLVTSGQTYLFLLPIYSVLLSGERIAHALMTPHRKWDNYDAASNIFITIVIFIFSSFVSYLLPVGLMALMFEHLRVFTLGDGLGGWAAAFVLYDLSWYVDHRIGHRTGFFWSMHHVHHSSPEYNMTVASRGFLLDATRLTRPTFFLLPLLGMSPYQFITVVIVSNIWGIAQHTRMVGRLGWLDWLFATPSNHRVHHASDEKYIDRNYGEVLMIWDRLFGTYQPEEEEPFYGVTEPINTNHPGRIQVAGLRWLVGKIRSASTWRDKLRCLYMPPEWLPSPARDMPAATHVVSPASLAES